ncbi:flagellar hook protein FlgE [Methylococcus sp. EFPC2]|uniref:flagellar hook protein FlgE n=1 Tax=Methylococcus sp. EFPC2 TaxID=2812648 RepID=UPI00196757D7|nr:flagellar hook protein FlgE [Methylococcus sp. EFPC2]QSA98372.1 flagellar hook protein FlgE [Methylococcus sp. EFPC2]
MSFNTALSGLNAASTMLNTIGNNIANSGTTGFKKSRAEFADVYATSVGGGGKTTVGSGVATANVAQLFQQGNIQSTGNTLDLAVSGEGFFVLGDSVINSSERVYTRAGMFHTDNQGYVVSNNGQPLLVQQPLGSTVADGFNPLQLQPLQIDSSQSEPQATTAVSVGFNLDARKEAPATAFSGPVSGVVDPNTYTHGTSVTVYDSLGNAHTFSQYFVSKNDLAATPPVVNSWSVYSYIDDTQVTTAASAGGPPPSDTLTFDTSGNLASINGTAVATGGSKLAYTSTTIAPNADPMTVSLDLGNSTQIGSDFVVSALTQDGLASGRLSSIDIDDSGTVFARFSNGANEPLGRVALVRFDNPQGLAKLGDTQWGETASSGAPKQGSAGVGGFGDIASSSLESANVELAAELVNLIIAQQAYQANAKAISTENETIRSLMQIQ